MKKRNLILILIGLIACILLYFIFSNIFLNKIWYKDFDKDGFGDPTIFVEKNIQPIGYVNNGDDMNDHDECVPKPTKNCISNNDQIDDTESSEPEIKNDIGKPKQTNFAEQERLNDKVSIPKKSKPSDDLDNAVINSNDKLPKIQSNHEIENKEKITEKVLYYSDLDQDAIGDIKISKEFYKGKNPSVWTQNVGDRCPRRKAIYEPDGCPKPVINDISKELYYGDVFSITPTIETIAGDKFDWTSDSKTKIISKNSKTGSFQINDYGLTTINFNISNSDGYNESASVKVLGRISNQDLENKVRDNILEVGQYDPGSSVPVKINSKADKTRAFILRLCDSETKVSEKGKHYGNNIGSFIDAKLLTKGSYVTDVKVNTIEYNEKKGLISSIDIELIKYN